MKNGVSILIPVHNEERIIVQNTMKLFKFLKKMNIPFEIILSDNGSKDRTLELAKGLQRRYRNIRTATIPQRGFVGVAFRNAALSSKYENLISLDMDLSSGLNFVSECLNLLNENYSVVIGSKKEGKQQRSSIRVLISGTYIFMTKLLLGINYSDYSIGYKGYKKDAIKRELNQIDDETFYTIQLFYFAKKRNLKVIEIPVYCNDKRATKFDIFHEISHRFFKLISFFIHEKVV